MAMQNRREEITEKYGVEFPDDLYQLWEFAQQHDPKSPGGVFDLFGIILVGPFEILDGGYDGITPSQSFYMDWRFLQDPAEFMPIMMGHTDGLHWGYCYDDPPRYRQISNDACSLSL